MVTKSNMGSYVGSKPACFGRFYMAGSGDCRLCEHSNDCMEEKNKPVEEIEQIETPSVEELREEEPVVDSEE